MNSFTVNNNIVNYTQESKKLITFLREDLRLTSVKDGCSQGACGTCTVLVDGKPVRACVVNVSSLDGASITTVDGLTPREKEVYSYCFAAAGAVQCGFCIPGIIMSAKALLDNNKNPMRSDIKKAIRTNICRCTGYVKIEDAILMAAEYFRNNAQIPDSVFSGQLGEDFHRVDAIEKTLGTGLYADDFSVPNMVFAKALRSKYPRARVLSIDISEAEKHSNCIKIITAEDIPGNTKIGHLVKDWDVLISVGEITRYVGDALVLAVTDTSETLDEVLALVKVGYEELTPMTSPGMSLAEGAPHIHEGGNILSSQAIKRGDAEKGIAEAKYVVTNKYSLPFTEHAFLEPECAVAVPEDNSNILLTLYTGGQSIYDEQREISELLGISPDKVRVKSMLVGGGFGGKEDMSVQHHAALAAYIVKKPVKVKFSRDESIWIHPKRHAMEITITTACDENGIITAVKAEIISDTGAYASLGGPVIQRACTHAGGPYNFQNIDITGKAVITNNPPAGAFRGFGVPQSCFAMESNLNELAKIIGLSQWEIRFRNAILPGQVLPNGQIADNSTALAECLLAVKAHFDKSPYTGIAVGFKNSGLGVGVPDVGRCILSVHNGKIHVRTSAACIGQGMATVLIQMVCQTLDVPPNVIVVETPDTLRTPNSGTTTASRQTLFTGEATVIAAKKLKCEMESLGMDNRQLLSERSYAHMPHPAPNERTPPSMVTLTECYDRNCLLSILKKLDGCEFYGEYMPQTDPIGSEEPNPVSHVAYGYAAQVAELDNQGKLIKVTAAYDLGTVVNPKSAEGQIEGGIVMGMGYALTEDYPLKNGYPLAKFGTLGLTRATEAPEIETIIVGKKRDEEAAIEPTPAYGAKGVGELATIPTAPAIHGAYYRFDGVFRNKLPMPGTFYRKKL